MPSRLIAALLACTLWTAGTHAQQPPIRIGVMADLSGLYGDIGGAGAVEATRMAVEDFGGTVLGRKIEVLSADPHNKPDNAIAIMRRWFDEGVEMITEVPTSGIALAAITLANEKKKLMLIVGAGSSDITGKYCSPYVAHWVWDTYAMAHGTGGSVVKAGGDSWFFITTDYVFGKTLEADTSAVVKAGGGKVLGNAMHPLSNTDFSSQLLQASSSGAKIIGLANAGGDLINTIKQAREYKVKQDLVALVAFISDIKSLGIETAQGTLLTNSFYWDADEQTRAWSKRFFERMKYMPSMVQAGDYSSTTHWLKAVQATGTLDPLVVMAKMRETPIEDFSARGATLRSDGRVMRDMYLYKVKTPAESKGDWDLYKLVNTIKAEDAFRPLSEGGCKMAGAAAK